MTRSGVKPTGRAADASRIVPGKVARRQGVADGLFTYLEPTYVPIFDQLKQAEGHSVADAGGWEEYWARSLVGSWKTARHPAGRCKVTKEIIEHIVTDLRAGRETTAALRAWLADALATAARTGDADGSFGFKNPKHRPRRVISKAMQYAAGMHCVMVWVGASRSEAANALQELYSRESKSLIDALADASRARWIDGPFVMLRPAPSRADLFETQRDRIATVDDLRGGAHVIVDFIARSPPIEALLVEVPKEVVGVVDRLKPRSRK